MQAFLVKFIKHLVRRSWSQVQVKILSEHDSKWPKDWTMKVGNSEDVDRKCWSLGDKEPYPTRRETDTKGPHEEGWRFQKTREASSTKEAANRAEVGPGRSAQASWPMPAGPTHFRPYSPSFDLDGP
jgi:hypothetical protein